MDQPAEAMVSGPLPSTGAGPACDTCERSMCGASSADCVAAPGLALAGPKQGRPRAELCLDLLACIRRTGCAQVSVEDCYCGAGVTKAVCAGRPTGMCRSAVEEGAESNDPAVVFGRLFNESYATGKAFILIEGCDRNLCSTSCSLKAGAGSCPPTEMRECPDLDRNCMPDCRETLVKNAGMAADTSEWMPETGVQVAREAKDAEGRPSSGALRVANARQGMGTAASMAGARQCVTVQAGGAYQLASQIFIPSGQPPGSGGLSVVFHGDAACAGAALAGPAVVKLAGLTETWMTIATDAVAPTGAVSMAVRLVVSKPLQGPELRALFDNVLVVRR
jgi:hypothetical protein